jgi:hypothetical protein
MKEKFFQKERLPEKDNLEKHFQNLEDLFEVLKVQKERLNSQTLSGKKIPEAEIKLLQSREERFKQELLEIIKSGEVKESFKSFIKKRKKEMAERIKHYLNSPMVNFSEVSRVEKKIDILSELEGRLDSLIRQTEKKTKKAVLR